MTLSFSQSAKTIFAGRRSRHQFGIFLGMYFKALGGKRATIWINRIA
jgi:hypothetical protein